MRIRKATPKDIPSIVPHWISLFDFETKLILRINKQFSPIRHKGKDFEKRVKVYCTQYLKNKNKIMLIAEENGRIAGFIQAGISQDEEWVVPLRMGTFDWMYVHPDFRGKGVSSTLYAGVRNWFKKNKCKFESVGIVPTNNVRDIYQKWGYTEAATYLWKRV
ncbi:MAG: GNAT family N-acetyltransferase [Nanoarchaeota archaeon]